MSISEFEKIGIVLGDARLLCQKYGNEERRRQLADIVSAVRTSSSSVVEKFKKEKSVAVDVLWHNLCSSKKRFVAVQRHHGGGTRTNKFNKCTILDKLFWHFKEVYFPNGKDLGI